MKEVVLNHTSQHESKINCNKLRVSTALTAYKFSLSPHRQVAGRPLQQLDALAQGALCEKTNCYQTKHNCTSKYSLTNTPSRHRCHNINNTATTNTHKEHRHGAVYRQRLTRALTYFCHHLTKEREKRRKVEGSS